MAWINYFKSFLPERYAVTKGFVFDSRGNSSDQIDVIIYDAFHSPLIFNTDNGEKYITAESVYAVFEVKQHFDKESLDYADKKIASVRSLCRTSRKMIASGRVLPARKPHRIIGGILSLSSVGRETLLDHLSHSSNVDLGCIVDEGSFLYRNAGGNPVDSTPFSDDTESVLSFYYLILDQLHKCGTVPAVDIRDYADLALGSFRLPREEF